MTDPADLKIRYRPPSKLKAYERNARTHPDDQVRQIRAIIDATGFNNPILLRDDGETIGAGHGRWMASLLEPALARVPTITLHGLTEAQWRTFVLADNRLAEGAGWNEEILKLELSELGELGFDIGLTGFSLDGLGALGDLNGGPGGAPGDPPPDTSGRLKERFGIVPFSVLNAREGWWQDRKRAWISLGIRSEIGRGENLLRFSDTVLEPDPAKRAAKKAETSSLKDGLTFGTSMHPFDETGRKRNAKALAEKATPAGALYRPETPAKDPAFYEKKRRAEKVLGRELSLEEFRAKFYEASDAPASAGTSIFDPVVCELAYRWFCPPGGAVLDPFAGGSVRGVVASLLGRSYYGVDLRMEQIEANLVNDAEIPRAGPAVRPTWVGGDSRHVLGELDCESFDFVFSCPPYADLEVYSEDPRDLSTMGYEAFLDAYEDIIAKAVAGLKPNRFAAFVVGDVRAPDGGYRGFVRDTEIAFERAGARLYNHAILVTAAGSLAMRTSRAFERSRKLGKTHQNILVFVKGDPEKATAAVGPCEFGEVEDLAEEPAGHPAGSPGGDQLESEGTQYGERLTSLGGEI